MLPAPDIVASVALAASSPVSAGVYEHFPDSDLLGRVVRRVPEPGRQVNPRPVPGCTRIGELRGPVVFVVDEGYVHLARFSDVDCDVEGIESLRRPLDDDLEADS